MAAKACVFCGAALAKADRTKEHILPMWLLRMTGDGRKVAWFVGYQKSLDCMWQLRRRLNELGIEFPDTNILLDEIQRFDRILEEQFAAAAGTLVEERPLIG